MRRFYFDYNATTPMPEPVRRVLTEAWELAHCNPSSAHTEGRKARAEMDRARERIAAHFGAAPEEIVFTSGATEAHHILFHSLWEARLKGRNRVITTVVEHDSVLKPLERLKEKGADLQILSVGRTGEVNTEQLNRLLTDETAFVSVMRANNETGILFPVSEIAERAHQVGAVFHTDIACAVGKIPITLSETGADYLSLSAHKAYGPKGVGALIIRKGAPLEPCILGGTQERGLRAGTSNVEGILGLAAGMDYALESLSAENARLAGLRKQLKNGLLRLNPQVLFHDREGEQLLGTLNAYFPGMNARTLLARLDLEGVAASAGAACHSGALDASRVLLAMGMPEEEAECSIRLSFGRMTTEAEVNALLEVFRKIL